MRALLEAIRKRPLAWLAIALGFGASYHVLLLGAMVARFGSWPNYVEVYDFVEGYRLTFAGTPSVRDALSIALTEPWVDIGYLSPQWGIAEWSLMILPAKLALIVLSGLLLATFAVLALVSRGVACTTAAGVGAGLVGMANATLFWVVCCATPTWVVALAMLGMSTSLALAIEPFGHVLTIGGLALLGFAITTQLRRIAARPAPSLSISEPMKWVPSAS